MQIRFIILFSFIFCLLTVDAQQTPLEIKYKAWDIHALRYYPFTQPADSLMMLVIDRKLIPTEESGTNHYEKIAVDLAMNKQFLTYKIYNLNVSQLLIYKYFLMPYNPWLIYARPVRENSPDLNLTLYLSERYSKEKKRDYYTAKTPLEWIGTENIQYYLEELLGEVELLKERNEVLFLSLKSPLARDAGKIYRYYFSSLTETEGIPVYEIAFFSHNLNEKAFEGYLYISVNDLSLVKAIFTLNPTVKKSPAKTALFIQTLSKNETLLSVGNETFPGLIIEQVRIRDDKPLDSITQSLLSPAHKEISGLIEETRYTKAYSNLQNAFSFFFTDKIGIFRDHFNLGPITQMFSHNYMEGFRLRIGGITSDKISKRIAAGGYLAYGTDDKRWKYRGDIIYLPHPKNQFRLTYVDDLNIPGFDCLEDKRDRIYYSLSQFSTKNMSLQKIGQLNYETDGFRRFSLKLNAKYMYDQPLGTVHYETVNNDKIHIINAVTTAEVGASVRYSPNEKHLHIKGKRIVFRSPDVDIRLNHRIGIKGIFGSDYTYHITGASLFKSFDFPRNTASLDFSLSGGKVWNQVPFPLLFIPAGNQSYIFSVNDYNLMRFYEFTTDRFVAGNLGLQVNWSPVKLFYEKSSIKSCGGIKAIYGPLSDTNNPRLHPELFIFNNGVEALGEKPYAEANIGFSDILTYLRVDYVYRLTYRNNYRNRGSLFISIIFNL